MNATKPCFLGLDIGGSSIKFGLVDRHGSIQYSSSTPTEASSASDLLSKIHTILEEARGNAHQGRITAMGIGIPGFINHKNATLISSPNLPFLRNVDLQKEFGEALPLPVTFENDANAAAWGEFMHCHPAPESMIFLTLGTGIGAGIILAGELLHGMSGFAAELGHMMVKLNGRMCGCGSAGCLEAEFSMTALKDRIQQAIEAGTPSRLHGSGGPISGRQIIEASLAGDVLAASEIRRGARILGEAIGSLINIFNPQTILLGGGMIAAKELILPEVTATAAKRAVGDSFDDCTIGVSRLGNNAGFTGAALLAKKAVNSTGRE